MRWGLKLHNLSPHAHATWGTLKPIGLEGSPLRLIIDGITSFSGQGSFGDAIRSPLKRVGSIFSVIRKTIWSFYSLKLSICQNIRGICSEQAPLFRELTYFCGFLRRCWCLSEISSWNTPKIFLSGVLLTFNFEVFDTRAYKSSS